jgi:hypothetical protein
VPVDIARDHLLDRASAIAARLLDAARDSALRRLHATVRSAGVRLARTRRVLLSRLDARQLRAEQAQELLQRMRRSSARTARADRHRSQEGPAHPRARLQRSRRRDGGVQRQRPAALNRELGTDFDLEAFEHTALWVEIRAASRCT